MERARSRRSEGVRAGKRQASGLVSASRKGPGGHASPATSRPSGQTAGAVRPRPSPAKRSRPAESAVETVEIRPSATIFTRRTTSRAPVVHVPQLPERPFDPPAWMRGECRVAPARAGDQHEILQLLAGLAMPPSRSEFHAAVDHPDHDSANRLVARLGGRIIGHAEIQPRNLFVGGGLAKAAVLDRIAVLPECRGAGHGHRLVEAAETRMKEIGAAFALSRTRAAASFQEMGWSVLGRDSTTSGRPASILARLLDSPQRVGEPVTMRQWRHVELPAILRIFRQNAANYVGPSDRGENYSRWLVSRGAFDSILVALVGQDRYDLYETTARIVGYCVQSGNRVLELLADPEFPGLEREILARVCGEAIENDWKEILLESSVADPLHQAVTGPDAAPAGSDRLLVAKLFDPLAVLEAVAPLIGPRLAATGLKETVELGLETARFRGSLVYNGSTGTATVQPGRVGRSYLRLDDQELARLLLNQCDPVEAAAAGRLSASTQIAVRFAGMLFPRIPLWAPMWDDLPA
jgi:N-acetylglutamate synthase-like GNAT family acetyltransferase